VTLLPDYVNCEYMCKKVRKERKEEELTVSFCVYARAHVRGWAERRRKKKEKRGKKGVTKLDQSRKHANNKRERNIQTDKQTHREVIGTSLCFCVSLCCVCVHI
jgi:hypothetical protein